MDKELLEQILPIVEKTKEGILKGVEIAQEQMPDLINQVLNWHFAMGLLQIILGVGGMILLKFYVIKSIGKWTENVRDYEDGLVRAISYTFSIIGICLLPIPIIVGLMKVIKISIAPKLFLIEYISNLIK